MTRSDIPDLLTVFFLSMDKLRYLDMVLECSIEVRSFSVFFASFLLMICHKSVDSSIGFSYNFSFNCSISKIKKIFGCIVMPRRLIIVF